MGTSRSSVELDQVLEDQPAPAVSAGLHKQSTFGKAAKFDRRETEIFRKRANLICGAVIVARQEHDSLAAMYRWILVKDGSDQMVETLDQICARKRLRDELGRRLSSQFLRGHAVGIGHIDDRLPLPGGERLRNIRVRLETDSQKEDVRLDGFRQCFGNDRGPASGLPQRTTWVDSAAPFLPRSAPSRGSPVNRVTTQNRPKNLAKSSK